MRTTEIHLVPQDFVNAGVAGSDLPGAHAVERLRPPLMQDEDRQRRVLRLLSETIKAASYSHNQEQLLVAACRVARNAGGHPLAWISLLARHGRSLHLQAQDGFAITTAAHSAASALQDIEPGDPAASAIGRDQPVVISSVSTAQAKWLADRGVHGIEALLILPLRVEDAVIGTFAVGALRAEDLPQIEVEVFTEMASELSLGIQMHRAREARRVAEHELRVHLQHFRTVLASQHAGILVVSEDGHVTFANKAFVEMLGFVQGPAQLENLPRGVLHEHLLCVCEEPERELARIRAIVRANRIVRGDRMVMRDGRILIRDFTPIRIDGIPRGCVWDHRDITEQTQRESRIERLAFYDAVTELPNRRLLFKALEQMCRQARQQNGMLAVGVLDLDRFKAINDSVGHAGGDQVLVEAALRMRGILREADVLARYGGDEFALIISGLDSREQLDAISRCLLQALRAPFKVGDEHVYMSASLGWTLFPLDDGDAESLLRHADMALYMAKDEGKDRGAYYEPALEVEQQRLQAMRDRVAQALAQSRLRLLFQPIVYIDGLPGQNGVAGMEALLRLEDGGANLIEPCDFMHVLDDPQLARPIGRYVLDQALRQSQEWIRQGVAVPVSINISTRHLLHPAFFNDIDAVLESYPDVMDVGFGVEVTETGPSMDHARAKIVIEECRQRGIRVSLDDFGTGSASLSHIQHLDIEHIKLDQSFVRNILVDDRNRAIAAGVITTARMLAKPVIAEGVESHEQGDLLASLGCHQLQGFSISRPMPGDQVPAWVAGWVPPISWSRCASERQSLLQR